MPSGISSAGRPVGRTHDGGAPVSQSRGTRCASTSRIICFELISASCFIAGTVLFRVDFVATFVIFATLPGRLTTKAVVKKLTE